MTTAMLILIAIFLAIKWTKRMTRKEDERYRDELQRQADAGDRGAGAVLRAFEWMDEDRKSRYG